jgi:thymidylate kinase
MIIALMGNDGSGKTTVAKRVFNFFEDLGFETYYRHEYQYVILGHVLSRLGKRNLDKARREMLVENRKSVKYGLWPFLVWFDAMVHYLYLKLFKRRAVVILDRYPYDQYLSFKYLRLCSTFIDWLYAHFPRPDVGIVLKVNPELAYERKKETHSFSLLFYQSQTEEYVQLAQKFRLPLIKTDEELHRTLTRIFILFLQDKSLSRMIFNKGLHNRIIFHVFQTYNLMEQAPLKSFKESYESRIEMASTSIRVLKNLLNSSSIRKYALIKTIDRYGFIGNDIDVLVGSDDLRKVYGAIGSAKVDFVEKIRYDIKKDKDKMDVLVKNGLGIDVHSRLGIGLGRNSRSIPDFQFEDLQQYVNQRLIYKTECSVIEEKANAVIIIYHILEKGFITYEDYLFLSQYWDGSFLQNQTILTTNLADYINWLQTILKKRPKQFPLFVPFLVLFKSYLKIVVVHDVERFWRIKLLLGDFSIVNYWRVRYFFLGKLPFQINRYANLWINILDKIS